MRSALPVCVVLFAAIAASAQPQAPSVSFAPWIASYRAEDIVAQQTVIDRAIDAGTEPMGPLRRAVGRRRLSRVNEPIGVLGIFIEGPHLVIEVDGFRFLAPLDGSWARSEDPFGDSLRISCRSREESLRCRFVGDDGEKRIDFLVGPGDRLTLAVSLISDQLPGVIRFHLPFRRAPARAKRT